MKYLYIFDHSFGRIYEAVMTSAEYDEYTGNIEGFLYRHFHLKDSNIAWMLSDTKLEIEPIEKH